MKLVVAGFLATLLIPVLSCAQAFGLPQNPAPTVTASVVNVLGVNTVEVEVISVTGTTPVWEGDLVRVRLIGIEATEGAEAFWEENATLFATMITGKTVYLAVDSASVSFWSGGEEPLLAYVYLDPDGETLVNSLLVSMGFAEAAADSEATATAEAVASSSEIQETTDLETSVAQAEALSEAVAEASSEAASIDTAEVSVPVTAVPAAPEPGFGCCCLNACFSAYSCQEALDVVCLTSPVQRGDYARLQIQTVPEAWCQIDVQYHSGISTDLDLSPRSAFCGYATWRWKVSPETPPGTWPILVTARLDGEIIGRLKTTITVRL